MANQSSDARKRAGRLPGLREPNSKAPVKPLVRVAALQGGKKKVSKTSLAWDHKFTATQRRRRTDLVMSEAKKAGLLGGPKDKVIRGRVPASLVTAAKKRAGVKSDTELLEVALSSLALEDDFGEKLLKRKGSIDPDIDLEF
jgi:hypothetical protein